MRLVFASILLLFTSYSFSQLNAEQKAVKNTFTDFLHFYQRNVKIFNSFELYKGTGKENAPPYRIQWKEVERYFTFLRTKVPYVSEAYIRSERNDFRFYDSCYRADPEEEIPVGFDFDRWAGGQEEVSYMVKWHTDPKNKYEVKITGNKAVLRIGAVLWEGATEENRTWSYVSMIKEKGRWKMASNITPEDEPDNSGKNIQ